MSSRHFGVRPNLQQLKSQAKDLLRDVREGKASAVAEFIAFHPAGRLKPGIRLADAQLALARTYGVRSWPRLVRACRVVDAIWADDVPGLEALIRAHPNLLHEMALGTERSSWGPPMSYAANLGRDALIRLLHDLGARDHEKALDRAALQGQVGSARLVHSLMGSPRPDSSLLRGPAYTLSEHGTRLVLELGAPVVGERGERLAPVDVVLESDSRKPPSKHRILEAYVQRGLTLPDTPPMAVHRGRIDLLREHLRRDPDLLSRRFSHEDIYPPDLGCHDEVFATHGTPLGGATLLHMCVDYDEEEIGRWLLDQGADSNATAGTDAEGFGGHTPLFSAVVSQPNYWWNRSGSERLAFWAELLLDRGADPNARASLRKALHPGYGDPVLRACRDVTPLSWGRRFHDPRFVSEPAMERIAARGGLP
ncbi:MAG: ankyrin repeat domain-containing protein [Gemmatimonadota bacterium]